MLFCFDTNEVADLDSTDIVDEYTTDCVVIDEPRNDAKVRLGFYFPHKYRIKKYSFFLNYKLSQMWQYTKFFEVIQCVLHLPFDCGCYNHHSV